MEAGAAFDLTRRSAQQLKLGWMAGRRVRGLWIAFPCTTWSAASRHTYRRPGEFRGRDNLTPEQEHKVSLGNKTLAATI
eukprot:1875130-Pyramimonas_sp.AAC.1